MKLAAIALGCLALTACAEDHPAQTADDHELTDALAGRVAGTPLRCIDNTQTSTVRIVSPSTILYSATGRTIYRNSVADCPSLRPFTTIITRQYGSQLCRDDLFRVAQPGLSIPSGFCRLSDFVPYTKP